MTSAAPAHWPVLVELVRPTKPIASAGFVLLGAYLVAPPAQILTARPLLAAGIVFLVTGFGFVVNDYYDVAVDALGKPQRPIPSGRISREKALAYAAALALAALALGMVLGTLFASITVAAIVLSWAYSYRLKSTLLLGNATVATLVAAALVFGALSAGPPGAAVWTAAALSFAYVTAQEAIFNLEDEHEDRTAGLRTTATHLGAERTASLIRALLVGFIVLALLPPAIGLASESYAVAALICLALPAAVLVRLVRAPLSHAAVARAAKLSRLVWVASFVPLALLK